MVNSYLFLIQSKYFIRKISFLGKHSINISFWIIFSWHHRICDQKERHHDIQRNFSFHCDCMACIKNYPQLKLKNSTKCHDFIKPDLHMFLISNYKIDVIKRLIPKYCDYLNAKSTPNFPNDFTNVAEEILSQFWDVVYTKKISLATRIRILEQEKILIN